MMMKSSFLHKEDFFEYLVVADELLPSRFAEWLFFNLFYSI